MFQGTGVGAIEANLLIVRIQPDEGISLRFGAKIPGPGVGIGTVKMEFKYADYFGEKPSTGYETLLFDCMIGDPTLFHRADVVEAGWAAVMPILDAWRSDPAKSVPVYPSMTWGPDESIELMARDNRHWRKP
jgi:glucose-6-phosphate 1-dehydrogenase